MSVCSLSPSYNAQWPIRGGQICSPVRSFNIKLNSLFFVVILPWWHFLRNWDDCVWPSVEFGFQHSKSSSFQWSFISRVTREDFPRICLRHWKGCLDTENFRGIWFRSLEPTIFPTVRCTRLPQSGQASLVRNSYSFSSPHPTSSWSVSSNSSFSVSFWFSFVRRTCVRWVKTSGYWERERVNEDLGQMNLNTILS